MASGIAVAASAPGKVLLVGAYLVVEPPNPGLVLATNARFYAVSQPLVVECEKRVRETKAFAAAEGSRENLMPVRVNSPQRGSCYSFDLSLPGLAISNRREDAAFGIDIAGQEGEEDGNWRHKVAGNPYVERAVQVAVGAALDRKGEEGAEERLLLKERMVRQGVHITIAGDNDFYSHRHTLHRLGLPLSASSLARIPAFAPIVSNPPSLNYPATSATPDASASLNTTATSGEEATRTDGTEALAAHVPEVAKTGLGSSAAMTAAVSAALLRFLGALEEGSGGLVRRESVEDGSQEESRCGNEGAGVGGEELIHRVAQVAHCMAQGKAGSGFDVAAAVYGSIRYQRFSPNVMLGAMGSDAAMATSSISATLQSSFWNHTISPLLLPPGLLLVLGEPGTGGTATPSMLSAVMRWRQQSPEEAVPLCRTVLLQFGSGQNAELYSPLEG